MYSLDQVICFLEQRQRTEDWNIRDEAIAYLKGYREILPEYSQMKLDAVKNEPLTWDELKLMAGKPVYITFSNTIIDELDGKGWFIIHQCFEPAVFGEEAVMYCNDMFFFPKKYQGTRWQAYRKERE